MNGKFWLRNVAFDATLFVGNGKDKDGDYTVYCGKRLNGHQRGILRK